MRSKSLVVSAEFHGGKAWKPENIGGGRRLCPRKLEIGKLLGEGSYGVVFEGYMSNPRGDKQRVVMKRVKADVEGAAEMGRSEVVLNTYASKVARGHCAEFLGYSNVNDEDASLTKLTKGLWLTWKYEGSKTLASYFKKHNPMRAMAEDMDVPEQAVAGVIMRQIFEGLMAFHNAGLVHRDIKPHNIIFSEEHRRFKLIDLGACADLRSGTNYRPTESILDQAYCPPELYVLPTDSPDLAKTFVSAAISPVLWARHSPDRFDTWSAGIVLLQMCVPSLRIHKNLVAFNNIFGPKFNYSIRAWRRGSNLAAREFEVLDAHNGAAWELLDVLLRPRTVETKADGRICFNDVLAPRLSASEALRHRFIKHASKLATFGTMELSPAAAMAASLMMPKSGSTSTKAGLASKSGNSSQRSPALSASTSKRKAASAARTPGSNGLTQTGLNEDFFAGGLLRGVASMLASKGSASKQADKPVKLLPAPSVTSPSSQSPGGLVGGVISMLGLRGSSDAKVPAARAPAPAASSNSDAAPVGTPLSASSSGPAPQSPAPPPTSAPAPLLSNIWQLVQQQALQTKKRYTNQEAATHKQVLAVKSLEAKVESGQADVAQLRRAEHVLGRMQQRMDALGSMLEQAQGGAPSGQQQTVGAANGQPLPTASSINSFLSSLPLGMTMRPVAASEAQPAHSTQWTGSVPDAGSVDSSSSSVGQEERTISMRQSTSTIQLSNIAAKLVGLKEGAAQTVHVMVSTVARTKKHMHLSEVSFQALLGEQPPEKLGPHSSYEAFEALCGHDSRFQAIFEWRRRLLFMVHSKRLKEKARAKRAAKRAAAAAAPPSLQAPVGRMQLQYSQMEAELQQVTGQQGGKVAMLAAPAADEELLTSLRSAQQQAMVAINEVANADALGAGQHLGNGQFAVKAAN